MDLTPFSLDAHVILGKSQLTQHDYHSLRVGDILLLDRNIADPLPLVVGEKHWADTTIGLEGIHKAIKIGRRHE